MPVRPLVPFPEEPVAEVFLPDAPLVAVVAQVRFPAIASIARQDFVGPFQEEIRADYPLSQQIKEIAVIVGPQGVNAGTDGGAVWRFKDKADVWGVSLAPSFVALETSAYVDRPDFVRRFHAVLRALAKTIAPATVERFGLRYADQIVLDRGEGVADIANLVRAEVRGIANVELGTGVHLVHSFNDTLYELEAAAFHARWGVVPPNAQLDPFHGDAVPQPSWLLDLDMYATGSEDFDVDALVLRANEFATRIYSFFRWVIEDELLKRCGDTL